MSKMFKESEVEVENEYIEKKRDSMNKEYIL